MIGEKSSLPAKVCLIDEECGKNFPIRTRGRVVKGFLSESKVPVLKEAIYLDLQVCPDRREKRAAVLMDFEGCFKSEKEEQG
jgi:hypothetical protein